MVFVFGASAVSAADTSQSSDYVHNQNLSSDEPSNITISGQVSYCSDGSPFEGAAVSVDENGTHITNTTTLADGSYTLNFQSISKDFTLTASYNGHKPTSQEITVEANSDGSYYGIGNFKLGNNDAYVYKGWETDSSQIITFSDGTNIDGTASNARTTIASGITYATSHPGVNTVYIAPGTYNEHGITISSSVKLCGEDPNTTIIDGQHNSEGIFTVNAGNVTMENLTMVNGNHFYGGAIYNTGGNLNITDCIFKSNTADGSPYGMGGAIYNYISLIVNITNCTFESNYASDYGGAISNAWNCTCNVNGSTFISNSASTNGGAISSNGQLTVMNSNFENNSAGTGYGKGQGGAIARNDGTCELHFNRFYGNTGSTASEIFCGASNPSGSVNATYNWWGSNNSPSTLKFYSIVYYSPWIVLTATANPTTIKQGESATITANLLYDNGILSHPNDLLSYYHDPANGHVPDGILATFSTSNVPSLGTLDPATSTTKNGTTTSSFRGTSAGTANINVNVDGVSKLVSVTIESVPVAADDTANTNEVTTLNGNVSTNDFPSTYGTNNWNLQNPPTHGTITFNSDGSYSYTPHNDYFGQDSFTYTISDQKPQTSNTATVTIHING
ncbi:MAG: hypothetical protein B655_0857, partial [Methanobacterium sp. Maddingley MBC34]